MTSMLFRGLVKSVTYVFDIDGTYVRRVNTHQNLRFLLEQHAEWPLVTLTQPKGCRYYYV